MFGFEYTYKLPIEITNNISIIQDFGRIEYSILLSCLIGFILMLFFILPTFFILMDYHKIIKEKQKKSLLLTKILLQKDIESEIEKELDL